MAKVLAKIQAVEQDNFMLQSQLNDASTIRRAEKGEWGSNSEGQGMKDVEKLHKQMKEVSIMLHCFLEFALLTYELYLSMYFHAPVPVLCSAVVQIIVLAHRFANLYQDSNKFWSAYPKE